jgi:AP2-like factor (ANT lineage)
MRSEFRFKGVTLNRGTRRFEACVWLADAAPASLGRRSRGRQLYCGSYSSPTEAAMAHDRVVLALYGCAAHKSLNFTFDREAAELLYAEGAASVRARVMRDGRLTAPSASSSGFIGVSQKKGEDVYEARCRVGNQKTKRYSYLGRFCTAADAARAYDAYALAHRGALTVTNFTYSEQERSAYGRDPPAETLAEPRAKPRAKPRAEPRAKPRAEPRAEGPVMSAAPRGDETDLSDSE